MGGNGFTLGLAVGGFLLASWVDARLGDARPGTPARLVAHVVAGLLVLAASVGALYLIRAIGMPQAGLTAAIFAVFLPALVYAQLTGVWLLRALAEITRLARH